MAAICMGSKCLSQRTYLVTNLTSVFSEERRHMSKCPFGSEYNVVRIERRTFVLNFLKHNQTVEMKLCEPRKSSMAARFLAKVVP